MAERALPVTTSDSQAAGGEAPAQGFAQVDVRGLRHPTRGPRRDALWMQRAWLLYEASRWQLRTPDDLTFLMITACKESA